MGRKSIIQKIKSLDQTSAIDGVAQRWAAEVNAEHEKLVALLQEAISGKSESLLFEAADLLQEFGEKRLPAIAGIFSELLMHSPSLSKAAIKHDQYSKADLARLLGVSPEAVNDRFKRGTLPPFDGIQDNGRGWWRNATIKHLIKAEVQ